MPRPDGPQFFNVSKQRFAGYEMMADWVDMTDPDEANDAIANAKHMTTYREHDVPADGLMALHAINKDSAREIMKSIKDKGFNRDNAIEVLGDETGGIVLDGHHRAVAARAAGMTNIPAVVFDPDDIANTIDVLRSYRTGEDD
jgi:hypothetical protein